MLQPVTVQSEFQSEFLLHQNKTSEFIMMRRPLVDKEYLIH